MSTNLEAILISVWQQVLVDEAAAVNVCGQKFRVQKTSRSKLREVDFECDGEKLRGLEQNPDTRSNWAKLARDGKKVMQFLRDGKYMANVVDGKCAFTDIRRLNERMTISCGLANLKRINNSHVKIPEVTLIPSGHNQAVNTSRRRYHSVLQQSIGLLVHQPAPLAETSPIHW
jgi:hypothetical protein